MVSSLSDKSKQKALPSFAFFCIVLNFCVMCKGFMFLPRDFRNWGWYRDSKMVHMLIHLMLTAQYQDSDYMGIKLKRGQLVTGRKKLSEETGLTEREVRTTIKRLENDQQIKVETTNKYSIVTLCNYEVWQGPKNKNDQQMTSKTPNERPADDHIQINKEDNNKEKEDTNVSPKKKKGFVKPTVEEVANYIAQKGYHFDAERFHAYYESNGWMVGKNKMKDWKASCRTWELKRKEEYPSLFSQQEQVPEEPKKIEWE